MGRWAPGSASCAVCVNCSLLPAPHALFRYALLAQLYKANRMYNQLQGKKKQ